MVFFVWVYGFSVGYVGSVNCLCFVHKVSFFEGEVGSARLEASCRGGC